MHQRRLLECNATSSRLPCTRERYRDGRRRRLRVDAAANKSVSGTTLRVCRERHRLRSRSWSSQLSDSVRSAANGLGVTSTSVPQQCRTSSAMVGVASFTRPCLNGVTPTCPCTLPSRHSIGKGVWHYGRSDAALSCAPRARYPNAPSVGVGFDPGYRVNGDPAVFSELSLLVHALRDHRRRYHRSQCHWILFQKSLHQPVCD